MHHRFAGLLFLWIACLLLPAAVFSGVGRAQVHRALAERPLAANVIIPQRRVFAPTSTATVQIERVDATVSIIEQVATTTLEVSLRNPTDRRLEAEVILPVRTGQQSVALISKARGLNRVRNCCPKTRRGASTIRSSPRFVIRHCWSLLATT